MAEWISVTEAARLSGYRTDYLRALIRSGQIRAQKFATVWQVDRASLSDFLRKRQAQGAKRGPKTSS